MVEDEDARADESDAEARFQRVEASLREEAAANGARPLRRIALGWLLFFVVLAGLALVAWPKIRAYLGQGAGTAAAGNQSGVTGAKAAGHRSRQAGTAKAGATAPDDYPPCTATRSDRCVQAAGK